MSRSKILSPKLSSLKKAKNETKEIMVTILLLLFGFGMENMPNTTVANSINVVAFSINLSSSEILFPISGDRAVLRNSTPHASAKKIKSFCFAIDLYKLSLFCSAIDLIL